ncbi:MULTISPECIES: dihydrolipoyllysine-residue acetyltransferase [Pseudidiomarina]|uniref:Acetyltransferase component of pyruvate dehydrogenase complex n=3 Tax=Pseudidiomarina TaxID=2800384 RepID=A0A368UTM5_9GAMM|nr:MULTISPECIES: dihydrolipoyllysine-residue acetyltransferase [Pseudidiomarina]MDT7525962.1 dihydrolipoyllysine-residue acetyltransferase [Pseudidiomarina sp. GXY010]PWW12983.1 pyruvate dehydrogenase E2 component (dihydrolipoamide acetyltransferase) [Pseudidiomarina maritima]RBP90483.1 pyruvate dehydrogenase E2 component (dihydrolipoamide acetyltransferase) [Pseudidiomarina tainanensis]RCW32159.1 pyruvate dehydrogenase E2 component (dihydrolipoamide acetyltransferase) [Pseudidiomarina tainanen
MADLKEVKAPDVGGDEVEVIEILVAKGDQVEVEDSLITVESDKASMDIPAPFAGVVAELKVKVGDKIKEGDLLAMFEAAAEAGADADADKDAGADAEQPAAKGEEQEAASAKDSSDNSTDNSSDDSSEASSEEQQAGSGATKTIDVMVPDIGESGEVDVIEVLVSAGDEIAAEDGLITLETDKATMDVPSPQAGVVESVEVKVGDKVKEGSLVVRLQIREASASSAAPAASQAEPAPSVASSDAAEDDAATAADSSTSERKPPVPDHPLDKKGKAEGLAYASPAVRRLAHEFGVNLTQVKGSGRKSRILKEDVQEYVKYELSRPKATASSGVAQGAGGLQVIAPPKVDFSKFGEVEQVPLTRIQKISGPNLHRNWVTIPHVTQFDEADITELEAFRKQENELQAKKKDGVKITPLVFIMKAVAKALREYPVFNSSLADDGEHLIMKKYVHIGIAVDTPNGLVVPVIRDVDKKGIYELSDELLEISAKARDGKLKAQDMQGGCFSISSLGGIGGTAFTPIVNAPDVAILGVSKSDMKPKWNGKEFEPRLMLPLSLSYDHRVIDGAVAARFSVYLSNVLSDIRKLVL